jgi:hypothetical protein
MPSGNVTAVYSVSGTVNILEQLMVNMPRLAPAAPGTPPTQKGTSVQGVATGSISITPSNGSAPVALSMPTGNVTATYMSSGTNTGTLERLMVNIPRPIGPSTGQGKGPVNGNLARVQGTLAVNPDGSITIKPTNGAAVTLTLGPNTDLTLHGLTSLSSANGKTASAIYDSQSKVANQVMVDMPKLNMPMPLPFRPGTPGFPDRAKTP